jgi:hypothetical protein
VPFDAYDQSLCAIVSALGIRRELGALYPDLASASLRFRQLRHPFLAAAPETKSLKVRPVLEAARWPASDQISPVEDYPRNSDDKWMQHAQGVTHDEASWYFTSQFGLYKFPVSANLDGDSPTVSTRIPKSLQVEAGAFGTLLLYDHMGAPAYHKDSTSEGLIYVPLEAHDKSADALLLIFDTNLNFRGSTKFDAQTKDGPWCAVHPSSGGLLYSSRFNDTWGPLDLFVYRRCLGGSTGIALEFLGTMRLRDEVGGELEVRGIQGGAFSSSGHLYLVTDWPFARPGKSLKLSAHPLTGVVLPNANKEDVFDGGVMGFDLFRGRRVASFPVDYQRWKDLFVESVRWQELEGITIWDCDAGLTPGVRGQVHVVMSQKDDELFFKHYDCGPASDIV